MNTNLFRRALLLLGCLAVFVPCVCHAGRVNVPGFSGQVVPNLSSSLTQTPTPSSSVSIPGFYGSSVTPPSSTQLPVLRDPAGAIPGIRGVETDSSQNQLTIHQDQPQAIIDWESFNIGADAWTKFDQQGNANWSALNRIWDRNPSLIFGRLTADGKIYLINQNGILFGEGSRVNVNSLVASALNITNDNFINNLLRFRYEDYIADPINPLNPLAAVSNLGEINAANGGSVFLIGPRVENFGSINAPMGQIGLAAGTVIDLLAPAIDTSEDATTYTRTALIVDVQDGFGEAVNREGGQLVADEGVAGMYGGTVTQDGLIRSVTAVSQHGQIELIASDRISTGSNSLTESPISYSSDTADNSFAFSGGVVLMHGNFENPDYASASPPSVIELKGAVNAPSGTVTLNADDRVFLETGSSISVGGAWSNETATAALVEAQLNSVELRDAYGQKDGLLQGQTITTNLLTGSSIGDISDSILSKQRTALERAVTGGDIYITGGSNGDIIVKQGATLDFSGGGVSYRGGVLDSTLLLSGTKIYDISNAPLNIRYDSIIGQYTKTYSRYGVQESYSGLYYGGAAPLKTTHLNSFTTGGDAGTLQLAAGTVVLDGNLNGAAKQGLFQNTWTTYDPSSDSAWTLSMLRGLEIPRGGTLIIGKAPTETNIGTQDTTVKEITVTADNSPLDAGFGSDPTRFQLTNRQTVITADTVNAAGLGSLSLYANTKITTDSDAHIQLSAGGNFTAYARRIENSGEISVPAGTITMTVADYILPDEQLTDEIFLASGSRLDVSGERIDNSLAGKSADGFISYGQTGGGTINLLDKTDKGQGVFIQTGAVVDVSGGYTIDQNGSVSGGNAGSLNIQGSNIMLNGELRGYALADPDGQISGGSVTLSSTHITVDSTVPSWPADFSAADEVPSGMNGEFVLAANRFDYTGFTQITLNSLNDIVIQPDTTVRTSLVRLNDPTGSAHTVTAPGSIGEVLTGQTDLIRLNDSLAFMAGKSSFTANAGQVFAGSYDEATGNMRNTINYSEKIVVSAGSVVSTAPEGKISLSAPVLVDMAGTLESLAGTVSLKTTGGSTGTAGDVIIRQGGQILAGGYNRPDAAAVIAGSTVNYTPVSGGTVILSAKNDLVLEEGSFIDLSGSAPVENRLKSGSGKTLAYRDASDPGSLSLTFQGSLAWQGDVEAKAQMTGVRGGTLTVSNTGNLLDTGAGDMQKYLDAGFDDVTLKSLAVLRFSGDMDMTVGRKLTLDAPEIYGSDGNVVTLRSPWIELANTSGYLAQGKPSGGDGHLSLTSTGWIDLDGSINISGFRDVRLDAARDIRLTDSYYDKSASNVWEGKLWTAGDLTMKADRIYPTTFSTYEIYADGKAIILPADTPFGGTIYSAGGNLTIGALGGIEVQGMLAAPMGTINLRNYTEDPGSGEGGRIYLAEGSVVTTQGDATVEYGDLDANGSWTIQAKDNTVVPVDGVPQKSVTINAVDGDVIVRDNAEINTSGGGAVFAYNFQPGVEGSVDPLAISGRYVILSDRSVQLPGEAVYLTGGGGLAAGTYSLLPMEYAFLPGAYVIELQSGNGVLPSKGTMTKDGYPISVGYKTVANTFIQGTEPLVYSVRPASDVLKEGHYDTQTLSAGDAGDLKISAQTTIIDGVFKAAAIEGFQGGAISLSGKDIYVRESTAPLPAEFDFSSAVPEELKGTLNVNAASLSGQGFREIDLGDETVTDNITITGGSVLEAPLISLTANEMITIETGAELNAIAGIGIGEIDLNSPGGTADIQAGSLLHASHVLNLDVGSPEIEGDLQVDHSALKLTGSGIFFVHTKDDETGQKGLYITDSLWDQLSLSEDITLVSASDLLFIAGSNVTFDLTAAGSLSIDAARIAGLNAADVSLTAPSIQLSNSGAASTASVLTNDSQIALNGNTITVGSGDILFGGFSTISLNSKGDLALKGKGSLATGNADLQISAARITTGSGLGSDGAYESANFLVIAGTGKDDLNPANSITMTSPADGQPGSASVPGGLIEFAARRIDIGTVVEVDGGTIRLTTAGDRVSDGIYLGNGAALLAQGTDDAPGGRVVLGTDFVDENGNLQSGSIFLAEGSMIDVSAGTQGDAGFISLSAPVNGVNIEGTLLGAARGGAGGSFSIDTNRIGEIGDISSLNEKLSTKPDENGDVVSGGFTNSLAIRARNGDLLIASGTTIESHDFTMTADGGRIDVAGKILAASETGGGQVRLYASDDLTLQKDGVIDVRGTSGDADGGTVLLSSAAGFVNLDQDSSIHASGSGEGRGGTVHLRALRTPDETDVRINMNGTIDGASAVCAEAVRVYDNISTIQAAPPVAEGDTDVTEPEETDTSIGYISDWQADTDAFMSNADAIGARLAGGLSDTFHLLPGIEVRNKGDIILGADWDLSARSDPEDLSTAFIWRYGSQNSIPGVLTLRAGGNLNISGNLADHPTDRSSLNASALRDSWAFNLTAGADMTGADYMSVSGTGSGDLIIADQKLVYTESAPVRFASAGSTLIGSGQKTGPGYMINSSMYYNLASFNGSIEGSVGKDLVINGGAIQTATGNITVSVAGDINLTNAMVQGIDTFGAIRTTGWSESISQYATYAGGGDITLDVGGNVGKKISEGQWTTAVATSNNQWDYVTGNASSGFTWSASYGVRSPQTVTTGLATMGGGDLVVRTGGNFLAQAGTFGRNDEGDLIIYSGENIAGRFLNAKGRTEIHAMGDFGSEDNRQVVEAFDSRIDLTAQRNIELAAVVNPYVVAISTAVRDQDFYKLTSFSIGYSEDSSVTLKAGGDVTFGGQDPFHDPTNVHAEEIMPPSLSIEAGGDILFTQDLALLPAPTGNLRLVAGGSIDGQYIDAQQSLQRAQIFVSDLSPGDVYGDNADPSLINNLFLRTLHASTPVHTGDASPVEVYAGQDIENLKLFLPKKAEITAENGDVRDIFYYGQNINANDVSEIRAIKGDILFSARVTSGSGSNDDTGMVQAGPGSLFLQAGGSITLGTSMGIQTVGSALNPILGSKGSDLIILSGYDLEITAADAGTFFDQIRKAGTDYSTLMSKGEKDEAEQVIDQIRTDTIEPLLGSPSGSGDIDMTTSQISTAYGKDSIYIITSGKLDVGRSTFFSSEQDVQKTGIFTAGGGGINIFANGDVNVNESRVMTFFGGDLTVWSDSGNINAGRGSKTEVNASPPRLVPQYDANGNNIIGYTVLFTPPAVGSGIRAVTFDPDGAAGPLQSPLPGDIYLFASKGTIDAGEAGISGGKIVLGATEVLNVGNISFSNGSIGVPVAAVGASGIGSLSGAGTVVQSSQLMAEASGIASTTAAQTSQMIDDIMTRWLDVRIIDYVTDDSNSDENKDK